MDKKTALVLFAAIVSFTFVASLALWLDPFQDSEVNGRITGTVKIDNVTLPLGDIIRLVRGDYTRTYPIGNSDSIDLSGIRDISIDGYQMDINVQAGGKNIDKLMRGLFTTPSNSYTVFGNTRIDFPRLDNNSLIHGVEASWLMILLIVSVAVGMILVLVSLKTINIVYKWSRRNEMA